LTIFRNAAPDRLFSNAGPAQPWIAVYLIGLTGGIAAGKSLAANWFRHQHIPVVDADAVAREVLEGDRELLESVRLGFGDSVFDARGALLRRELGRIVFAEPARLQELNDLVYPRLAIVLEERLAALGNRPLAVLDAALIFEWGIEDHCDEVWVIHAPDEVRIRRIVDSRGLGESEARDRLASQLPAEDKAMRAHRVIRNEGTVAQFVQRLRDEAAPLFAGLGLTLREESGT